jgi:septal ring factor EnvC (AmiA/AmiB activator)
MTNLTDPPPRGRREADRRIIDMSIPLTWLLSTAAVILCTFATTLWNIAAQSNKLDQLIAANAKLEKRLDDRDLRVDALRDRIGALERSVDALTVRMETAERIQHKCPEPTKETHHDPDPAVDAGGRPDAAVARGVRAAQAEGRQRPRAGHAR